ncbi:MAG: hypothetical protein GX568_04545 [Candidatus Gastranaerophilales bacterium]|nr:hypothetical protein [Candidatus Gastranaerophilales bacterium]
MTELSCHPELDEVSQVAEQLNIKLADIAFSHLPSSRVVANILAISPFTALSRNDGLENCA